MSDSGGSEATLTLPNFDPLSNDYRKTLLDLVVGHGRMREQLGEVIQAIQDFREERKAEHFTRKDIIITIVASVGSMAVLFAGLFFLIGTQVNPTTQELHTFKEETLDRFRQTAEVYGDRMKAQLEGIQANRAVNIEQDKEINDVRLEIARLTALINRNSGRDFGK